jgi:heme/copper-type cytochrome/quinol oxidase subunit 3
MSAVATTSPQPTGARAVGWWGMALVIVAELALFGTALAAYFFLRYHTSTWPPDGIARPDLALGGIATALLVGSSFPMFLAERAIQRGDDGRLRLWMGLAMILAIAFLSIQAYEYATVEFSLRTDAYGSLFFTITSLHALHVIVGLLICLWLVVRTFAHHFDADHHVAIQAGALYWHFVDAVWIAIFLSLYVSPHLG